MENDKIELKEKLNSNYSKTNLDEVVEYCKENIEQMNISNETDDFLCRVATQYLMKYKIGEFDIREANFLTLYFAKFGVKSISPELKVDISIVPKEEYEKISEKGSNATCISHKDNSYTLIYSEEKVSKKLMTNNPDNFLRAMQTILHEVVHVQQKNRLQSDYRNLNAQQAKRGYILALETVTRHVYPEFYKKNYNKLLTENDAEKNGLLLALDILRICNKSVYEMYSEEEIKSRVEQYDNNALEEKEILKGKLLPTLQTMEFIAAKAQDFRDLYPILNIAYHQNGDRKSIVDLLKDREDRMLKDKTTVLDNNELVYTILNSRGLSIEEIRAEIEELDKHIVSKGEKDEFAYELLGSRLQKYGAEEAKIQEYIKMTKAQVKGKSDDEKTNKDEQEEWLETMKGFNEKVSEMDGHAKKQETMIKFISSLEEQKTKGKDLKYSEDITRR